MKNSSESTFVQYKSMAKDYITLRIFEIVDRNSNVSQGKITMQTGLAAGLVHSYMSNIIAKGWIRAKQVNAKRWLYFMTPEGFIEKGRLTMRYLSRTLKSYHVAQLVVRREIDLCLMQKNTRFVIIGDNAFSEVVALNLKTITVTTIVAVLANNRKGGVFADVEVAPYEAIKDLSYDRAFVCDVDFYDWLADNGLQKHSLRLVNLVELVVKHGTY